MDLRILVVDDDEDLVAECRRLFKDRSSYHLDCAGSRTEAFASMGSHIYDIIFVDLQLDEKRPKVLEGEDVLDYAARHHRLASLYAWTSYPGMENTRDLIVERLLNPDEPIAASLVGLIDKTRIDGPEKALSIADRTAKLHLSNPVSVDLDRLGIVVARLSGGRSIEGWTVPAEIEESARLEELQYLVTRLFGQGTLAGQTSLQRNVEIDFFDELGGQGDEAHTGNSGATVFLARVMSGAGSFGEWVVLKVGSKSHVANEVGRYERYVRYDRSAKHRVELLGSVMGNNIGAIAYSLAGPDPQRSQTVRAPIKAQHSRALTVIGTLFSEEWKHWHGLARPPANPMRFMQKEFQFTFNDRLRSFLDGIRAAAMWRVKQSGGGGTAWWTTEGDRSLRTADLPEIHLPGEDLNNRLSVHVPFSICHGDSHAANIICTEDDLPRLIDYAATGPGPRVLDYVVFEASHRVIEADSMDIDACARRFLMERDLWNAVWEPEALTSEDASKIVDSRQTFWEKLSATTLTRMRVSFPDARPEEYASVAILHGVRLSPAWWIDDSKSSGKRRRYCAKVRLAAWMAPLVETLHPASVSDSPGS